MRIAGLIALSIPLTLAAADLKFDCAQCHQKEAAVFTATGMSRSLAPAAHGKILSEHRKLEYAQGDYKYTIERDGDTSWYRVYNDHEEYKAKIGWAFGRGMAGQTYLIERNGHWYEGRVSYYRDIDGLGLTVGARPEPPRSLEEAVGREMSIKGASECFNCHTTGAMAAGVLRPETLTPGIQCQRCHADSDAHQAGFLPEQSKKGTPPTPLKMGGFSAEDMNEQCGACHRTWQTIAADGPHNITNVRFQPYRLTNSKCYDAAETRIKCTVCHDVHNETERPVSFYDAKCQACHSPGEKAGTRLCKVAKQDCVTCHMPKVKIESAHHAFTDHWIRIARKGEPDPY